LIFCRATAHRVPARSRWREQTSGNRFAIPVVEAIKIVELAGVS
jgi:hypothetical protein